jgi:hypothetical protein
MRSGFLLPREVSKELLVNSLNVGTCGVCGMGLGQLSAGWTRRGARHGPVTTRRRRPEGN